MNRSLASYQDGRLTLLETPVPQAPPGGVVVQVTHSVISPGTERLKVEQARMSLLAKARARPDQVRQVLDTARTLGWKSALEKVRNRLESPAPLGYSATGLVVEVHPQSHRFRVGDLVACGGAECAHHAEFIAVPDLLTAAVPEGVLGSSAAYTTLASIAMEAVRQAKLSLGERVLIIGQGLVGLLCTALAKAAGARVCAVDPQQQKRDLAQQMGAEMCSTPEAALDSLLHWTHGTGVDAALICVGGTERGIAQQAIAALRDRGTIVIVGQYDAQLSWREAYIKDIRIHYSRSYGAGRYDPSYEWAGQDYPIGHVRWTENRNFQACLHLMQTGQLRPELLTTRSLPFAEAVTAYADLLKPGSTDVGVVLEYGSAAPTSHPQRVAANASQRQPEAPKAASLSIIGAGNFARSMLLPHLRGQLAFDTVVNASPLSAQHVAGKFGFRKASTSTSDAVSPAVIISTRDHLHAPLVADALQRQQHIFVEKPLCLTEQELANIMQAHDKSQGSIMVGFNRRFAPAMIALKEKISATAGAISLSITVNAGRIPAGHWYAQLDQSGGRVIGEACHFFDLATHLLGPAESVHASPLGSGAADSIAAQIQHQGGHCSQIIYSAEGDPSFPKESIRAMGSQWVIESGNCLDLTLHENRKRSHSSFRSKGHQEEMQAWLAFLKGKAVHPMPWRSVVNSTNLLFAALASVRENSIVKLGYPVL
jgi:predicted dehydrogenase